MKTNARKDGSDWVLNGSKRWIGMGFHCRCSSSVGTDPKDGIRGFLVPTDTTRLQRTRHRAQAQSTSLHPVRSFTSKTCDFRKKPCYRKSRDSKDHSPASEKPAYGIIWGVMGAARDCYESALEYSKERETVR